MKVTMICTVMNEEHSISKLVDSVINQTRIPDEYIIVDGGSKDKTFNILQEYASKYKWIKVYQKIGLNIAEGRNFAVEHSIGDIIFTSDASTEFEDHWIEKFVREFENGADVVFGCYYMKPKTLVEQFLLSRMPNWDKINPNIFVPSNRHAAFMRKVWDAVGYFPEKIRRADDNVFHDKAHKLGFKYVFARDASVYWYLDRSFKTTLRLAYLDSKSESFLLILQKRKNNLLQLAVLFAGIAAVIMGATITPYIFLSYLTVFTLIFAYEGLYKTYRGTKSLIVALFGVPMSILLFFAHVFGLIVGLIERLFKTKE